ncbi:putative transcriptional regulator [Streptococcus gallolyticus]|uniref:Putative transcriptional regulator n=1 Tax=Streptococcus gallolyticus TaxID=315405 RepID=A0A1H7X8A0_9STRE|nr:helix-turn-helix transcriptional regulator [Streptococcus gallolyticus]SEF25331.1 putative transcriptional regulator [Streptococcus gallolyticus]SEM30102.1 putative transcriptional regulator [Streptococcus gallolyticus]
MSSKDDWIFIFLAFFGAYLTSETPNPRRKELLKKQFLRRKQLLLVTRTEGILVLKNRLKELRARDGLNQTQLAKLAKVSRQTISLLERNEYTPSVIIALRIAHIFNEPVENVFSLDEEGEEE